MNRCVVIDLATRRRVEPPEDAERRAAITCIASCLVLGASCIGFLVALLLLSGCGGADAGPVGTTAAESRSYGVFCIAPGYGPGESLLTGAQLACATGNPLSLCPAGTATATACAVGSTVSGDSPCTLVDPGCGGGTLVACCPGVQGPGAPRVAACIGVTAANAADPPSPPCYSEKVGSTYYWCCP